MSVCALCGTAAPPPFRAPQQESSPDLDGRPGEPTRSTLRKWLVRCPGCHAYAPDVARLPASAKDVVASDAYRRVKAPFLCWAALVAGTDQEAAACLQAAWQAEDEGQDATDLRKRAAAAWPPLQDEEQTLRLADVQRRAGLLGEAVRTLDRLPPGLDDAAARIAAFERARLAAGDTGRHLLSSALRPPARTPHVTHRQRKQGGFWSRLTGRQP